MKPPEVVPDPDWEEFRLPFDIGSGRSMFVETKSGPTIRMRFFKRRSDDALVGRVWFGRAAFGPPGFAHGGVVAYVLDEAMGSSAWLAGYPSVAANLNIDYVEMTPLDRDCLIEARTTSVERNKLVVEAELTLDDRVLVRGQGIFARIRKSRLTEVFKKAHGPLPELDRFRFAD